MNRFECVIPILNVKSFAASMDYYITKLGFTKKWEWGTPPTFGCVERGKAALSSVKADKASAATGC